MTLVMVTVLLVSVTGTVLANQRIEGEGFDIEVSPNVLNIASSSNSGSIHSNIPDAGATDVTLAVNGTGITFDRCVDDCGHLVLKFDMETVKDIVETEDAAKFVLTCLYAEGETSTEITADDTVTVISVP